MGEKFMKKIKPLVKPQRKVKQTVLIVEEVEYPVLQLREEN